MTKPKVLPHRIQNSPRNVRACKWSMSGTPSEVGPSRLSWERQSFWVSAVWLVIPDNFWLFGGSFIGWMLLVFLLGMTFAQRRDPSAPATGDFYSLRQRREEVILRRWIGATVCFRLIIYGLIGTVVLELGIRIGGGARNVIRESPESVRLGLDSALVCVIVSGNFLGNLGPGLGLEVFRDTACSLGCSCWGVS